MPCLLESFVSIAEMDSQEDNGLMEARASGSSINAQITFMQNQGIVAKPNQ